MQARNAGRPLSRRYSAGQLDELIAKLGMGAKGVAQRGERVGVFGEYDRLLALDMTSRSRSATRAATFDQGKARARRAA